MKKHYFLWMLLLVGILFLIPNTQVNAQASAITFTQSKDKVKVGKTIQFQATADDNSPVTYSVSDEKIATITADGKLTGQKIGSVKSNRTKRRCHCHQKGQRDRKEDCLS